MRRARLVLGGAALALAAAVGAQVARTGCLERSLSAYYWTPARVPYVAALLAFAAWLVVAPAATRAEGVALDVTGALAALVAVLPADVATACSPGGHARSGALGRAHVVAAFLLFLGLFAAVVAGRHGSAVAAMGAAGAVAAVTCLAGWGHWFVVAEAAFAAAFGLSRTRTAAGQARTPRARPPARAPRPTTTRRPARRTPAPRSRSPRTTP